MEYIKQHFAAKYPDRLRMPLTFDPVQLAEDMQRLSATTWVRHVARQNYEGDWTVLPLRGPAGETHPLRMIAANPGCQDFEDTRFLDVCPYIRHIMSGFACPLRCVRLMRLSPGSAIKEHEDVDLSFENGTVRLHVPVVTSDGVDFRLNGTRVVLDAGSCWYLRLSDPHRVTNGGTEDRVHLVVDATVNEWVGALFDRAMREPAVA